MARKISKRLLILVSVFAFLFILAASQEVSAQYGEGWVEDDRLHVRVEFDGQSITDAPEGNPITIQRDRNMTLYLEVNVTNDVPLNMSGKITFYYQGIAILPIEVRNPYDNTSWVYLPHDMPVDPVEVTFNFGQLLELGPVDTVTGVFQASLDFNYYEMDLTDSGRSSILHTLTQEFFLEIPSDGIIDVLTSVAGASAGVATVGAVAGFGGNLKALFEGIQTAHKVRSIQKKTGEIRSLPNLTVLGALPALMTVVAGMVKIRGRKKNEEVESEDEHKKGVSDYILKQRLREVAPEAWPKDKCPQCLRKWNEKTNTCKKCNIGEEAARQAYAERMVGKVEPAIKALGKKKELSIRKLAKKTKSTEYNAGVIGAAMVDTDFTSIEKIETPIRGFAMNVAGLIFLVITWQQLLGGATSQFQTTLTLVGAGLSFAVIVALYVARKTQLTKLQTELDEGGKMLPTTEEKEEIVTEPSEPEVTDDDAEVEEADDYPERDDAEEWDESEEVDSADSFVDEGQESDVDELGQSEFSDKDDTLPEEDDEFSG